MCRHIVIVLPYCASCDALEELIKTNKDKFRNLDNYEIVNISGVDKPNAYKSPKEIKTSITNHEQNSKKTITLTVNRMLTGSTVPEWDTMLYLKDTASPQEYDQAVFRLQNQYVKTFKDETTGKTIKFNMKPQTLLVDFDPNRMFVMQEKKSKIYNANVDTGGNSELEKRIRKELEISPIITINKDKIERVVATDILEAVSNYQKDKGIKDEALEIPVDLSILDDSAIRAVIELENEIGSKSGLSVPAHDGENEDDGSELDVPETPSSDDSDDTTPSTDTTPSSADDKRKQEISLTKKVQSYYTRILLFAFITKDTVISLSDIIEKMETEENGRIAKNLGLSKQILALLNQKTNKFVLSDLDYKIQDLNSLSRATDLTPAERANVAVNKFGKLGDAIVTTPSNICDDMVNLLPEEFIKSLPTTNGKVLDIAGTAGEFAVALHKRMTELGLEKDFIATAIYTIPKSSICYELTRKLYEMLELNTVNIAKEFISSDILNIEINDEIDYDKIKALLTQNKPFETIKLTDTLTEGETEMLKFEAVVGNPPYQDKTIGDNKGFAPPIYHNFMNIAFAIAKKATLIHPARFLFDGGSTPKEWNRKMLNDSHLTISKYFANSSDIFNNINIMGGIAISYRDFDVNFGAIKQFIVFDELRSIINKANNDTSIAGLDTIIYAAESYRFAEKVHIDYPNIEKLLSKGHKYDFKTSVLEKLDNIIFSESNDESHNVGIFGLIKGKKVIRYIASEYLRTPINFNSFKVFVPKANGSNAIDGQNATQVVGTPFVVDKSFGHTQTYMSIGNFENKDEAVNLCKFIKTKFCRVLLGALKITQDNPAPKWKLIPLQDFTANSDIDWSKSIPEIDQQLYKKYNLTEEEISFIESMIKPME